MVARAGCKLELKKGSGCYGFERVENTDVKDEKSCKSSAQAVAR